MLKYPRLIRNNARSFSFRGRNKIRGTKKLWIYTLIEDFEIPNINLPDYEFVSGGKTWLKIKNNVAIISANYSLDGCSSSPDCKKAMPGCILHDALFQALREDPYCPFSRKEANTVFKEVMKMYQFRLYRLYYLAVNSILGDIYWKLKF